MSRANRSAKDRLPNAILFLLLRSCSFIDSPSLFQSNLARLNVRLSMTRVWSSCGSRWSRLARADDLRATNFATNTNERIIIFFSSMNFCLWKTKRRFVDLNLGFTRVHSPSFVLVCLVWIQLHDPRNDLDSLVFETHLDSLLIFFLHVKKVQNMTKSISISRSLDRDYDILPAWSATVSLAESFADRATSTSAFRHS